MSRRYPRLGNTRTGGYRNNPRFNETCACCDKKAIGFAEIQFGWMRGSDDERYWACGRHIDMAEKNLDGFLTAADYKAKRTPDPKSGDQG